MGSLSSSTAYFAPTTFSIRAVVLAIQRTKVGGCFGRILGIFTVGFRDVDSAQTTMPLAAVSAYHTAYFEVIYSIPGIISTYLVWGTSIYFSGVESIMSMNEIKQIMERDPPVGVAWRHLQRNPIVLGDRQSSGGVLNRQSPIVRR